MLSLASAFAAGLFGLAPVPALQAQRNVVGTVHNDAGQPVVGAIIVVGRSDARAVSDADGRFVLASVPPGVSYLTAKASGLVPSAELIRFTRNDSLDIQLDRFRDVDDSVAVAELGQLFAKRTALYASAVAASRTGVAFTDREIDQRTPSYTSELFRDIVGFRLSGDGAGAILYAVRGGCEPVYFLNGREMLTFAVNDVKPRNIKLLVAYNGYAVIPAEMRGMRVSASCGAVSIITK